MSETKTVPVVVTTSHRGVFFGHLHGDRDATTVELTVAQMCIYWSADVKGVMGLASAGPSKSCRVGPPVPRLTLQDVTAVIDVTEEAEKRWQAQPWS
jgi:hypothetical protein